MAFHEPGSLTSSMPAMVAPRKTSSASSRSRGAVIARREDGDGSASDGLLTSGATGSSPSCASLRRLRMTGSPISQSSIRLQLAHGARLVATFLQQAGEVVVCVGVLRIDLQRALVRSRGIRDSSEILQRDAEVERGDRMIRIGFERGAIMLFRGRRRALLVKQASQVHMCVGVIRIELQRALVRVARVIGRHLFEMAAGVVPIVRIEIVVLRARYFDDFRDDVVDGEIEERWSCLGIPAAALVTTDEPLAVRRDSHSRQTAPLWKLLAQTLERALHFALWDVVRYELTGRSENDEIVKSEPQFAARSALGGEESFGSVRPNRRRPKPEHRRDLAERVGHG